VGALVGWPLRVKPRHRYLDWEHWDEDDS